MLLSASSNEETIGNTSFCRSDPVYNCYEICMNLSSVHFILIPLPLYNINETLEELGLRSGILALFLLLFCQLKDSGFCAI